MEHEQLLTPSEVASVLRISMRTLLRIRKSGALRETRAGQSVRFTWDQINDYIRSGNAKPSVKRTVKERTAKNPEQNRAIRELADRHGLNY